jgi:hypothetical protein
VQEFDTFPAQAVLHASGRGRGRGRVRGGQGGQHGYRASGLVGLVLRLETRGHRFPRSCVQSGSAASQGAAAWIIVTECKLTSRAPEQARYGRRLGFARRCRSQPAAAFASVPIKARASLAGGHSGKSKFSMFQKLRGDNPIPRRRDVVHGVLRETGSLSVKVLSRGPRLAKRRLPAPRSSTVYSIGWMPDSN